MVERDGLGERGRKHEEDYFRKRDRELIERMRQAAAAEQTRKDLQAKTGLQDPELLRDLEELGFTPDTIALLPLVPVLQVAWAEGGVSPAERKLIVEQRLCIYDSEVWLRGRYQDQLRCPVFFERLEQVTFEQPGRIRAKFDFDEERFPVFIDNNEIRNGPKLFTVWSITVEAGAVLDQVLQDRLVAKAIDLITASSQKFLYDRFGNPSFDDVLEIVTAHGGRIEASVMPEVLETS